MFSNERSFCIAHFNDVYELAQQMYEPVGGVSRFQTMIGTLQETYGKSLITCFSGDIFSPSCMSTIFKGEQMIFPFNSFKVDVACFGNHDLDFPMEQVKHLTSRTNVPWLLSNVYEKETNQLLAGAQETHIREVHLTDGTMIRVGFMGLAEEEWLGLLPHIPLESLEYEDNVHCAQRLSTQMRSQGCQLIVALTHMRVHNDMNLMRTLPAGTVDLVLGGHDHVWQHQRVHETLYLKSGTNFKNLGLLKIVLGSSQSPLETHLESTLQSLTGSECVMVRSGDSEDHLSSTSLMFPAEHYSWKNSQFGYQLEITLVRLNVTSLVPEDPVMLNYVNEKMKSYLKDAERVLGYSDVDLETRFKVVRTKENNFGNFYADLLKSHFNTDVAIINNGAIRSDEIIKAGPITYQTLNRIFAIPDCIVTFKSNGQSLYEMLENSVSKWPQFDGRFCSVSGIKFKYHQNQPSGQRVQKDDIQINGQPLDYSGIYTVAAKYFLTQGMDGFKVVLQQNMIIDRTVGVPCLQVLVNFFEYAQQSNDKESIKNLIKEIKEVDGVQYYTISPQEEDRILQI